MQLYGTLLLRPVFGVSLLGLSFAMIEWYTAKCNEKSERKPEKRVAVGGSWVLSLRYHQNAV